MKRLIERPRGFAPVLFLVAVLMLSGCANKNTITTTYPDGRVVTEELSDDAANARENARVLEAAMAPPVCPDGVKCTEAGLLAQQQNKAIIMVSGRGTIARGMNGIEGAVAITKELVPVLELGTITYGWVKAIETPRELTLGANSTYTQIEQHITGSTQVMADIPFRSPVTTYTPVPVQ